MPQCSICGEDKKLTREHTVPNGILNRIENLPQGKRPNLIWTPQMSKIAADDNHTIRDLCGDCQKEFRKAYDDRVDEAFDALMDLQDMRPPGSITVEEPWFTLYLLRIFWNMARTSRMFSFDPDLSGPIVEYAKNQDAEIFIPGNYCLGISCFPSQTFPSDAGGSFNTVFYAGISPDKHLGPDRIRVKQAYMRLLGLRFLYMQADKGRAADPRLHKYYEDAVGGKNGVLLQPNSRSKVTYKFLMVDPDITDPRSPRIVNGLIGGKPLSSLV